MLAAPKGREFYFCDGKVASSVEELVWHIRDLSPEQYKAHVSQEKNDFYNWINDCINKDVAGQVKGFIAQRKMIEILTGHHWETDHKKKHNY